MLMSMIDLVNTSPIPVWWSLYHYPNIARRRRKFFRVLLCKHTVRCRSDSWWSLILNCSYYICAAGEIFWSIQYMHIIWAPAKIFWGCDTNLQILKGLHEARDFSEEDLLRRGFYASHGGVTPSHYYLCIRFVPSIDHIFFSKDAMSYCVCCDL